MSSSSPTTIRALSIPTPGQALWNQREKIAEAAKRIRALSEAIGRVSDFSLYQWVGIFAFALEFRPDLILELGRATGNSTCCFLEVANSLGGADACKLISLCMTSIWSKQTLPRIEKIVSPSWLAAAEIRRCNILDEDLSAEIGAAKRFLLFWDAHGFEIAEWVLCKVLPCLTAKPHLVVMHDVLDLRYAPDMRPYGERVVWRGQNSTSEAYFCLGNVLSNVAQAISVVDFSTRNALPLHSADESLYSEVLSDANKAAALKELLGEDLFASPAHWLWFTLNEAPGELSFPRFLGKPRNISARQRVLNSWRKLRDR